jgi:hypothetical protein
MVTAVSKALIGQCDQIIRSGSRHFGHYVKDIMIATFLIGSSMVEVYCDWFVRFTQNPWRHPVMRPTLWSIQITNVKMSDKRDARINGYRYLFAQLLWVESFNWSTRWSGNRHLGHYVKDRMIATFLIGPNSRVTAQKDHESWGMCIRHVLE